MYILRHFYKCRNILFTYIIEVQDTCSFNIAGLRFSKNYKTVCQTVNDQCPDATACALDASVSEPVTSVEFKPVQQKNKSKSSGVR